MQTNQTCRVFVAILAITLSSCSTLKSRRAHHTLQPHTSEEVADGSTPEDFEVAAAEDGNNSDARRAHEIENYSIGEVLRVEEPNTSALYDNSRYDFPITMNSRVEGWIDYFTGRGRPHMERYLGRSSRYIPLMKQILKREGMPEDLVYLALIESGFNLRAKSRAKAVGPWQFIKATGRRYGLRVDGWLDERQDPVRSTEAAASYLKDLYLMFESWYLAAAAYNAGEYKILRSIGATKSNNFWTIAQTSHLRRETKDYVPKLIAAAIIAKNPEKYGFDGISYLEPLEYETVPVRFSVSLKKISELVDAPEEEIHDLNPHLRRAVVPPGVGTFELRVPVGSRALVERAVATMNTDLTNGDSTKEYTVRRGDNLNSIARKFGVKKNELASINNLGLKEKLEPGTTVLLPRAAKSVSVASNSPSSPSGTASSASASQHTVRAGESLWSIAEQYDVTIGDLFEWNDLENARIFPGKKLEIHSKALAQATPPSPKTRVVQSTPTASGPADNDGFIEHRVQNGETVWSIAEKYNVSVRQIYRWNGLRRSRINVGDALKVKAERGSRANQLNKARSRNA